MPKKARKQAKKRSLVSTRAPIIADPVKVSVQAMLRPFDAPKGLASPLAGITRPSQKFMAKASTSITVPGSCTMVFMVSPCIANDSTRPSVIFGIQAASGTPMSGAWKNSVAGNLVVAGGTISTLATNTPYSLATLNSATGYEWQSVSSGLKFSYEGTVLNQSGTFVYLHDPDLGYSQGTTDLTTKGPADVVSYVSSAPNAIRQNIVKNSVVEMNTTVLNQCSVGEDTNIYTPAQTSTSIGGASSTYFFARAPVVLGYFVNGSSNSVSFHVEAIEHWVLSAPSLQALHTDSVSHPVLVDQVQNFLQSSRQMHATNPNTHHTTVMKNVQKAVGSPLGHEVLSTALAAALA